MAKQIYGSGLSGAVGKVFNTALQIKQQQLAEAKQGERDLLSMVSSIHPQQMISERLNSLQAEQIDKLTKNWASIYRNSNGKPTTMDKMKILQDQQKFMTWQSGIMAGQKEASKAIETIKTRPEDFDSDFTANKVSEFMNTGIIPADGFLDIAPADLTKVFGKYSADGQKQVTTVDSGGRQVTQTIWEDKPEEELNAFVDYEFAQSPNKYRTQKAFIKKFESLPEEKQAEYSAKAEEARMMGQNTNAILLFARDDAKPFFKQNVNVVKNVPLKPKTTGSKWSYMYGKDNMSMDDILGSEMKTTNSGDVPIADAIDFGKKISHDFVASEYYDMTSGDLVKENPRDLRLQDVRIAYLPTKNGQLQTSDQLKSYGDDYGDLKLEAFVYGAPSSNFNGKTRPVAIKVNDANLKAIGAKLGQDITGIKRSMDIKGSSKQVVESAEGSLISKPNAKSPKIPFKSGFKSTTVSPSGSGGKFKITDFK